MNVVVPRLGARKTVLIGSVLVSLSTILASLTNDLTSLICVHSVLMGMGSAMLVPPGIVLIGSYFRKRRSLAIAIGKCGGSVGGMALPPLVTYFLSEYGLRGALLLTGGLFLHCLPAALLLRPVSFYSRRHRPLSRKPAACDTQSHETQNGEEGEVTSHEDVDTGSDETKLPILDNVHGETAGVQQTGLVRLFHERECTGCAKNSGVAGISRSSQDVGGRPAAYDTAFSLRRAHSISDHFRYKDFANGTSAAVQMLANGPDGYTSTSLADRKEVTTEVKGNSDGVNVHQPATHRFEEEGHCCMNKDCWVKGQAQSTDTLGADELSPEAGKESGGRMCSRLTHLISAVFLLDLSLLRSALFRLLLLHVIMAGFVYNVTDYLPAVAAENGINNRDAALLLTIVSGLDFVCRFLSGVIADLKGGACLHHGRHLARRRGHRRAVCAIHDVISAVCCAGRGAWADGWCLWVPSAYSHHRLRWVGEHEQGLRFLPAGLRLRARHHGILRSCVPRDRLWPSGSGRTDGL
ncbi:hypothetical protein C0Q70_06494 [Pomacea canaliculata]|uniref:Major facilitator superfamily (MFS) profile domain-containing protein n=1 Tax=Pomacea canaliculata TaxID=400727 RepID=A0A2T7PP60_POMCA|nr:hypothetical protein C0Q70_06494 [Pomacea canaliculata]